MSAEDIHVIHLSPDQLRIRELEAVLAQRTREGRAEVTRLEARIAEVEDQRDLAKVDCGLAEDRIAEVERELEARQDEAMKEWRARLPMYADLEAAEARCEALSAALREIADPESRFSSRGHVYTEDRTEAEGMRDSARDALATSEQARTPAEGEV